MAGLISRGRIEYGLIPLGTLGLAGTAAALACPALNVLAFGLGLAVLGFFGGFFIVPVSALLQHRPSRENKGGVLAAANPALLCGHFFLASERVYYLLGPALRVEILRHLLPSSAAFTTLTAVRHSLATTGLSLDRILPQAGSGQYSAVPKHQRGFFWCNGLEGLARKPEGPKPLRL